MAAWKYTINLKPIWENYEDLDHEDFDNDIDLFVKMKGEVIGAIKQQMKPGDLNELGAVLTGMEKAKHLSAFNNFFSKLYDFCDFKRIWLKTSF